MDSLLNSSLNIFAQLAQTSDNPAELAGRYECDSGKEPLIMHDIMSKLGLSQGMKVLDIGCGCGGLAIELIKSAKIAGFSIDLLDIQPVLKKLKSILDFENLSGVGLFPGVFPSEIDSTVFQRRYDRIICYSVVQYTTDPKPFISFAVQMLNPRGMLLLGDLPNVNKKGRFICSDFGRKFDANYKKIDASKIPVYSNHIDFAKRSHGQNKAINDDLILELLKEYRSSGYNSYIVPQPVSLPCSFTREDMIIERV